MIRRLILDLVRKTAAMGMPNSPATSAVSVASWRTEPVHDRQRRVLRTVLVINVAMFLVEVVAGAIAHSTALLADSADMLGDSIVYGISLYVIARGPAWQARGLVV